MEVPFRKKTKTKHHKERLHILSNICKSTAILVNIPGTFLFQQNDVTTIPDE